MFDGKEARKRKRKMQNFWTKERKKLMDLKKLPL